MQHINMAAYDDVREFLQVNTLMEYFTPNYASDFDEMQGFQGKPLEKIEDREKLAQLQVQRDLAMEHHEDVVAHLATEEKKMIERQQGPEANRRPREGGDNHYLTKKEHKMVDDLFRLIDGDGNQRLQKEELRQFVTGLTGRLKDTAVDAFLESIPTQAGQLASKLPPLRCSHEL